MTYDVEKWLRLYARSLAAEARPCDYRTCHDAEIFQGRVHRVVEELRLVSFWFREGLLEAAADLQRK